MKGKVLKIGIVGRVFAIIKEVWNRGMHKLFATWASCTLKTPLNKRQLESNARSLRVCKRPKGQRVKHPKQSESATINGPEDL